MDRFGNSLGSHSGCGSLLLDVVFGRGVLEMDIPHVFSPRVAAELEGIRGNGHPVRIVDCLVEVDPPHILTPGIARKRASLAPVLN